MKMNKNSTRPNGFAIIAVLAAVAILLMLYMLDLSAVFGPGAFKGVDVNADRPWFEQDLLLAASELPVAQAGKDGKTVIEGSLFVSGKVYRKDKPRGQVEVEISPAGAVIAQWQCQYSYSGRSYSIDAAAEGNIVPSKTYADESGKKPGLLYFIAKGTYQQSRTYLSSGKTAELTDTIYITGWIDNEYNAFGSLFTMTGEKEHSAYSWKSE